MMNPPPVPMIKLVRHGGKYKKLTLPNISTSNSELLPLLPPLPPIRKPGKVVKTKVGNADKTTTSRGIPVPPPHGLAPMPSSSSLDRPFFVERYQRKNVTMHKNDKAYVPPNRPTTTPVPRRSAPPSPMRIKILPTPPPPPAKSPVMRKAPSYSFRLGKKTFSDAKWRNPWLWPRIDDELDYGGDDLTFRELKLLEQGEEMNLESAVFDVTSRNTSRDHIVKHVQQCSDESSQDYDILDLQAEVGNLDDIDALIS